jgi:uncharacterized protein with von Willebrand factor type A (vWA) domain
MEIQKTLPTENLARFLQDLREKGLLVSTAEAGDAAALLSDLGMDDRSAVRTALQVLLAKTPKQIQIFDDAFDHFFVGQHVLDREARRQQERHRKKREKLDQVRDELSQYDAPDDLIEAFASVNEDRQDIIRKYLDNAHEKPRNTMRVHSFLRRMANSWMEGEAGLGLDAPGEEEDLLHKNLASISEDEIPRALTLIEMLVRRINRAADRKFRRTRRHGMPDIRSTIHHSLKTCGVPVIPCYKRRPVNARQIVILCDVSESMYMSSGFVLKLITSLAGCNRKTRGFLFSEGIQEISFGGIQAFEEHVKSSVLWRKGTDLGSALLELAGAHPPVLTQHTIFIIMSDAKTINTPLAEEALMEIPRLTRRAIWLNPDPRQPKFAETVKQYIPMLDCSTLEKLAIACTNITFQG